MIKTLLHKTNLYIILGLLVLLPVQNILSQLLVFKLGLPTYLLAWKEVLILISILIMMYFIVSNYKKLTLKDILPIIVFILLLFGITLSSFYFNRIPLKDYIFGFRFELFWLGYFVLTIAYTRIFNLSGYNRNLFKNSVYIGFAFVVVVSSFLIMFGEDKVLSHFGFVSSWSGNGVLLNSPVCHSVDGGQGGCRLSGGFSTPNHFAGYLLLILPVFIINFLKFKKYTLGFWLSILAIVLSVVFIILTVARFAWVGLAIFFVFSTIIFVYHQVKRYSQIIKYILFVSLLLPVLILGIVLNVNPVHLKSLHLPSYIYKPESSLDHYRLTNASIDIIKRNNSVMLLGYGLGQSGPYAKPQYKDVETALIATENQDIAIKYNIDFYKISVPENWFLQVWLNGGIFYFILYTSLILFSIKDFILELWNLGRKELNYANIFFGLGFFGIIVGNLFLHIWENQTIAIYWTLIYLYWKSSTQVN